MNEDPNPHDPHIPQEGAPVKPEYAELSPADRGLLDKWSKVYDNVFANDVRFAEPAAGKKK